MEVNQEICEDLLQEIISSVLMWSLDLIEIRKGVKKAWSWCSTAIQFCIVSEPKKICFAPAGNTKSGWITLSFTSLSSLAVSPAIGFVPYSWALTFPPGCRWSLLSSACLCLCWAFQGHFARYDPDGSLYRAKKPRGLCSARHEGTVMISLEKKRKDIKA